jgi:predicted NBD/HSP70 family sugar kinase
MQLCAVLQHLVRNTFHTMIGSSGRLKLMKRNSRAQITLALRKSGLSSRVDIARMTGLSVTCVCGVVDELLDEGVLVERGASQGRRGGPKRVLLEINPDGNPVAGVAIQSEIIEVGIADPQGVLLSRKYVDYKSTEDAPEAVLTRVARAIRRCAQDAGKDPRSLNGIGVSVVGLVDTDQGIVHSMPNRPGWENVPLVEIFSRQFHLPVFADNDIRAGATAAQLLTEESRPDGVLYLVVREGIGAAFVDNRELFRGAHDAGCLLGHVTMDPEGPLCDCGKRGCLAAVATDLTFIRAIWPNVSKSASQMTVSEREHLVKRGLNMAAKGDPTAHSALEAMTRRLGIALANAVSTFDPRTIFIGGTIVEVAPDTVIDMIRKEAVRHIWRESRGVEIRPLQRYEDFALFGATGLVLCEPYRALQQEIGNTRTV